MKTLADRSVPWIAVAAAMLAVIAVAAVAWFGDLTATFVASALSLTGYYFTFRFTPGPGDPRGIRVRVAFLGIVWVAWLATAVVVARSAIRGHWL